MLSGETASGKYPRQAVDMMARIILEAEADLRHTNIFRRREQHQLTISEAICEGAAHLAEELSLRGIALFTASGNSARLISKYRPRAEVFAFSHLPAVCNRMNLFWGVRPVLIRSPHTVEEMVEIAEREIHCAGVAQAGDIVALVAGTRMVRAGSTNFIRLHHLRPLPEAAQGNSRRRGSRSGNTIRSMKAIGRTAEE
jgi:pyruvate kinase